MLKLLLHMSISDPVSANRASAISFEPVALSLTDSTLFEMTQVIIQSCEAHVPCPVYHVIADTLTPTVTS